MDKPSMQTTVTTQQTGTSSTLQSNNNPPVSNNTKFDFLQKVIIIGDSGVGKSNILLRFSANQFSNNYMVTIGINYMYRIVEAEGVRIKLQIWDTAGQDKYKAITRNYYEGSNGIIVAYAVDSRESFKAVSKP